MSDYVPSLPSPGKPGRILAQIVFTIPYLLVFLIFGFPQFRFGSTRLLNGTRYSEYVGLGGYKYLVYQNPTAKPPLFILLPFYQSKEFKNAEARYQIRRVQPE